MTKKFLPEWVFLRNFSLNILSWFAVLFRRINLFFLSLYFASRSFLLKSTSAFLQNCQLNIYVHFNGINFTLCDAVQLFLSVLVFNWGSERSTKNFIKFFHKIVMSNATHKNEDMRTIILKLTGISIFVWFPWRHIWLYLYVCDYKTHLDEHNER